MQTLTRDSISLIRFPKNTVSIDYVRAARTETATQCWARLKSTGKKPLAIQNGGLFHIASNATADSPVGTPINDAIDDGKLTTDRGFANWGLRGFLDGSYDFGQITSGAAQEAIGASPILVQGGKASTDQQGIDNNFMTAVTLRSFYAEDKDYFYMGCTNVGYSIPALRAKLVSWGITNAINVDGGGSTHHGVERDGALVIINRAIENRAVSNHIVVYAREVASVGKTVFLDAGHGGTDPGAVNGSRKEAADNLRLGLAVRDLLKAAGYTVVMARTGDVTLSLADRTNAANAASADLYVSLHRNSFSAATANGVETWVYSVDTKGSRPFAEKVQDRIVGVGVQTNRGVKAGNYHVLRESKMPAMLIELGFISNAADNGLFDSRFDAYANAVAQGIVDGLGSVAPAYPAVDYPTGTTAAILADNCEYFSRPSVVSPIGKLPVGTLPAVRKLTSEYEGFSWTVVKYSGADVYVALLSDRVKITEPAPAPSTDIVTELTAEIDKLKTQLADAQFQLSNCAIKTAQLTQALLDIRDKTNIAV